MTRTDDIPTNEQLREVIKLAEQATPGPWKSDGSFIYSATVEGDNEFEKFGESYYHGELICESVRRKNLAYFEATSPPAVIAMARELLRLRGW